MKEKITVQEKKSDITIFNLVNFSLTIIAISMAIFFFFKSIEKPNICYSVHPDKTTILKNEMSNDSDLEVFYNRIKVEGDITLMRLIVWNDGNKGLYEDGVKEILTFHLTPSNPILELRLDSNRERCNFSTSQEPLNFNSGVFSLSWDFIEKQDRIEIDILYNGPIQSDINAYGSFKGQVHPTRVKYRNRISSIPSTIILVMGIITFFFIFFIVSRYYISGYSNYNLEGTTNRVFIVSIGILLLILCIWAIHSMSFAPKVPGAILF